MGSPALFSNNAPPPIPGGFGNPTGMNTGNFNTTPSANTGPFGATDFSNLSTGFNFGPYDTKFSNLVGKIYGQGAGSILNNIFTQGLFNPQVASNLLNALQPGVSRGEADILNAFGAGGNRFSSSAALGLGDFESQVNLNQGQILSNLFQSDQAQQLSLLAGILPDLQKERANSGGLLSDILGGLEAVGGAIAAPFTGGLTIPLISNGINTITGKGGGSSASSQNSALQALAQALGVNPTSGTNTSTLAQQPSDLTSIIQMLAQSNLAASAGATQGGQNINANDPSQVLGMNIPYF